MRQSTNQSQHFIPHSQKGRKQSKEKERNIYRIYSKANVEKHNIDIMYIYTYHKKP